MTGRFRERTASGISPAHKIIMSQNKKRGALPMVKLTLPIAMEQFFRILVSSVDTMMLSSYSNDAVAAVGLVSQYVFFLTLIFSVIGTGCSIVLAQYLGAQKPEHELNHIAQAGHVYSVDEVFIDATEYLKTYRLTARQLAMKMIKTVLGETGITATAGRGTNLYLCKVAMDAMLSHEIAKVVDTLRANQYKDNFSLADMAAISRMPMETFRKRFVAEVGMPPLSYVLHCKMERAKELLRDQNCSVRQAGVEVGMQDPYHFSKQFKHIVGISPSAFMKQASAPNATIRGVARKEKK